MRVEPKRTKENEKKDQDVGCLSGVSLFCLFSFLSATVVSIAAEGRSVWRLALWTRAAVVFRPPPLGRLSLKNRTRPCTGTYGT